VTCDDGDGGDFDGVRTGRLVFGGKRVWILSVLFSADLVVVGLKVRSCFCLIGIRSLVEPAITSARISFFGYAFALKIAFFAIENDFLFNFSFIGSGES
jgi:hypothetical protein